jgi:DNA helicase-2/ATP-dependent DNA helicase PcrA
MNSVNGFREDLVDIQQQSHEELPISGANVVQKYLELLDSFQAVDFSGMLYKTWQILKNEEVAKSLSDRFQFVLVDEMQDTNRIQYEMVRRIASHGNLFVVGDIQQSVYGWRGARPENIDKLKKDFDGTSEVVLPRNYRSTTPILSIAQNLIRHNSDAEDVKLISDAGAGPNVVIKDHYSAEEEAKSIIHSMMDMRQAHGYKWRDFAILYRMNSLSNSPEMFLRQNGIPYRIVSGFSFFDRAEVKTTLAYLSLVNNPADTIAFARAVGSPRRGIGETLIGKLERLSEETGKDIISLCLEPSLLPKMNKAAQHNLTAFANMIRDHVQMDSEEVPPSAIAASLLEESQYMNFLEEQAKSSGEYKDGARKENVEELIKQQLPSFVEDNPNCSISDYLQTVQLYSDLQDVEDNDDAVTLLTMHAAKGLEWPCVFVIGVEQDRIPHIKSNKTPEGIREERRLMYVAITRAERHLTLSYCHQRRKATQYPSRFLHELSVG